MIEYMYTNVLDNNAVTFRVASFFRSHKNTSLMKEVGKQWWQHQNDWEGGARTGRRNFFPKFIHKSINHYTCILKSLRTLLNAM